jgi:GT2 family glycosyltransferase
MVSSEVIDNAKASTLICAVVVTYGDRWFYLKVLLDHLEKEARVCSVVVVDNASRIDVAAACRQAGLKKVFVLRQEANIGSAGGFSVGIEFAITLEGEFVMLFDDDTVPHDTTIDKLMERLIDINSESGSRLNAVLPNRQSQSLCLKAVLAKTDHWMAKESVFGLNVFNFIQRHFLKKVPVKQVARIADTLDYGLAAYAGLMFHKCICDAIGFPDRSFMLYYDDIEYTNRILTAGGKIWICIDLGMDDIVDNYSSAMMNKPFVGLIFADHDAKVYYQIRNQLHFEFKYISRRKSVYFVNVLVYAAVSLIISIFCLRFRRAKAIQTGICHGMLGNLGINKNYQLG